MPSEKLIRCPRCTGYSYSREQFKCVQICCGYELPEECRPRGLHPPQPKHPGVILPCPFCGEQPAVLPKNPKKEGSCFGMLACRNPECFARPIVQDGEAINDERGSDAYILAAIIRWNKRS